MSEEINDIIEDFTNEKKSNSSYSISSNSESFEEISHQENINLVNSKRQDEFLFYNNHSPTDSNNNVATEFELNTIEKSYFTSSELDNRKEDIIKLFYLFDVVILTDDYRIKLVSKTGWNCFWKSKKYINPEEFPGILFLSFNSINLIKKSITKHNDDILHSDSENFHKELKYQICFDEGDIYKNMVYKKIQIKDKLLFVPMSKYQLKLTEYRLRGFCQIMEELGAVEIEIEFNNGMVESSKTKSKVSSTDYNYIAGSLGFTASSENSDNKEITYKLIYPKHNTFILNSKVIKKKIMSGRYIISKKNFDSNLELQYIIDSRCRHFITNYSTVFTLDNSVSYDFKLIGKLQANKFNLGFESSSEHMKNLKLSINTKVKFCDQKSSAKNLLGDNVSWDSIGFNYLVGTLSEETFKDDGIFKIIFFVHKYIDKVIFYKNKEYYYNIKKIYKIMNKEFSFIEYRDLLLEHFNIHSHWLHFLNFIDILVFKSVSYDKLGFLVLMSQSDLSAFQKNQKILNFIRHSATKQKIEEQFWEMLEPNNYYSAVRKLDKEYDILSKFNWFNLEKLLYDLKKYKTKKQLSQNEINYVDIYENFILGHKSLQFEHNIKPFLIKYINNNYSERINKIEPYLSGLIFNIIRKRHLLYYDINTDEKLKQLIETKIIQIEEGQLFFTNIFEIVKDYDKIELSDPSSNLYKDLFPFIQTDDFKEKYPYIYRKLTYILDDYSDVSRFVKFCKESNIYKSIKSVCLDIIKKIIFIDYKFNIDNIELDKLGFNYLLLNLRTLGSCKTSIDKIIFFKNLSNFIISQKISDFKENIISLENLEENLRQQILKCGDFNNLIDICYNYLNNKYNLNIDTEFYYLMKK